MILAIHLLTMREWKFRVSYRIFKVNNFVILSSLLVVNFPAFCGPTSNINI